MSSILLSGPAVEPVTLDEAKSCLRVETADDDATIAALIAGARVHIETQTRRALITQTWRLIRDAWPAGGRIAVLPAPLRTLLAARIYDGDGNAQAIDPQSFVIDTISAPGLLSFAPWSVPQPGRDHAGIELDVSVGYGDAAADVPEPLKLAIRLLVAHWYENRGVVTPGASLAVLPANVAALIAPYRVRSL